MNGECPLTSTLIINAHAAEVLAAGAQRRQRPGESSPLACEDSMRNFVISLFCLLFETLPALWKCRGPTPRCPRFPSSPSAMHLCANVDARFTAPTDKEKPSVTPSLWAQSPNSEENPCMHVSDISVGCLF